MKKYKVILSNQTITIKADSYGINGDLFEFKTSVDGKAMRRSACMNKNCVVAIIEK